MSLLAHYIIHQYKINFKVNALDVGLPGMQEADQMGLEPLGY